ncbi:MAG: NAD-dependent epimerase/dehydratase family protein [Bryobacteraceae bacterium]
MIVSTEEQLEEVLSVPNEHDAEAIRKLDGDLILLGVAGKMGPSLARRAARARELAGVRKRILGVSRFSDPAARDLIEASGVETISGDLTDSDFLASLPSAENVIFMAGRKFGSTGNPSLTWAMNVLVPGKVAERFRASRIVAFSSGNVYPLMPLALGGATESTPVAPVGEYAQSAFGRERMFEYGSQQWGTPVTILRLNYAIDLRYGVLLDIGRKVFDRQPVDLAMGHVNVIWQGDANSICLRSFALASTPPTILNLTGPETASVRWIARRFGEMFGVDPVFDGAEGPAALLNNASKCHGIFGYPTVTLEQMIVWVAAWIGLNGRVLNKPTHFEVRDGKF